MTEHRRPIHMPVLSDCPTSEMYGDSALPDVSEMSPCLEGMSPLDSWRSYSSDNHSLMDPWWERGKFPRTSSHSFRSSVSSSPSLVHTRSPQLNFHLPKSRPTSPVLGSQGYYGRKRVPVADTSGFDGWNPTEHRTRVFPLDDAALHAHTTTSRNSRMVKEEGSIQEEEDPPSPLILPAGLHQDSTVRAESVSLSPSPENSPAQGPTRQFCPLSPLWLHPRSPCSLGPITCNELIHPILSFGRISDQLLHETSALQDSLRFNSTATQKRVPLGAKTPTKMGSSSNGPSPDKTTPPERTPKSLRFHSPNTLFYRFSPVEVPNIYYDKANISPSSPSSLNQTFEQGNGKLPQPLFPENATELGQKTNSEESGSMYLRSTATRPSHFSPSKDGAIRTRNVFSMPSNSITMRVEVVQCQDMPAKYNETLVVCCASLHRTALCKGANAQSRPEKLVSKIGLDDRCLRTHLRGPQHTTQTARKLQSSHVEIRDSFSLDRVYALLHARANANEGWESNSMVSLMPEPVDLVLTVHNNRSLVKEVIGAVALRVWPGAAVDQWFNFVDLTGQSLTSRHGTFSSLRAAIYFPGHYPTSSSGGTNLSPWHSREVPRDWGTMGNAKVVRRPFSTGMSVTSPLTRSSSEDGTDSLAKHARWLQAMIKRTLVSRWYSSMLLRFSNVVTTMKMKPAEVKNEVRPNSIPGAYTELVDPVDRDAVPTYCDGLEPLVTQIDRATPETLQILQTGSSYLGPSALRSNEPKVVQTRACAGNHRTPRQQDASKESFAQFSAEHSSIRSSGRSQASELLKSKAMASADPRSKARPRSPDGWSGPMTDRKFLEAEAFAKLARRLKENGYDDHAQMYCRQTWNLLHELNAADDERHRCIQKLLAVNETGTTSAESSMLPKQLTFPSSRAEKSLSSKKGLYSSQPWLGSPPSVDSSLVISNPPSEDASMVRILEDHAEWGLQATCVDISASPGTQSPEIEDFAGGKVCDIGCKLPAAQAAVLVLQGLQVSPEHEGRTRKEIFKKSRKLPAAEAAVLVRQGLGEPVWTPSPPHSERREPQIIADSASVSGTLTPPTQYASKSTSGQGRSKLLELEEQVRKQMMSVQRAGRRQTFNAAASMRTYGDKSKQSVPSNRKGKSPEADRNDTETQSSGAHNLEKVYNDSSHDDSEVSLDWCPSARPLPRSDRRSRPMQMAKAPPPAPPPRDAMRYTPMIARPNEGDSSHAAEVGLLESYDDDMGMVRSSPFGAGPGISATQHLLNATRQARQLALEQRLHIADHR